MAAFSASRLSGWQCRYHPHNSDNPQAEWRPISVTGFFRNGNFFRGDNHALIITSRLVRRWRDRQRRPWLVFWLTFQSFQTTCRMESVIFGGETRERWQRKRLFLPPLATGPRPEPPARWSERFAGLSAWLEMPPPLAAQCAQFDRQSMFGFAQRRCQHWSRVVFSTAGHSGEFVQRGCRLILPAIC